ncbi:hypothetical protein CJF40_19465 [Pseudomonas lundensis]|uniref:Tn3 transposase DDE domain-containing protein n=1 Tax=Pseudomonas lundensis TaxID=86185 RepID=A0ABX4GGE6_9PSED|nr:hypothetical protein CJF40_19465 [Pseudomonas lundensis]OZY49294.1 hypothetical protein CJF34_18105 [Pseudomonas lundensis]OZY52286.1 hypothetical protein CJF38_21460 [Pseudomonas lundensis]
MDACSRYRARRGRRATLYRYRLSNAVCGGSSPARRSTTKHYKPSCLRPFRAARPGEALSVRFIPSSLSSPAQSQLELAQVWGGGEVASADGIRFVVPVRTVHAGPNPKYFGTGRGVVSVRPTHLPGPDAKGDGVHLI